jgi:hypothetical protein
MREDLIAVRLVRPAGRMDPPEGVDRRESSNFVGEIRRIKYRSYLPFSFRAAAMSPSLKR